MKDIGLLSLTRFGDLVQTTPVLVGLRRRNPGARIHLLIKSRFRSVAEMLPGVDVIHEIDGDALAATISDPRLPFADRFRWIERMLDRLCEVRFDTLLNFTHSRSSAVLLSLLNAEHVTGFTLDRSGQRRVNNAWLTQMATVVRARHLSRFNLVDMYLGAADLAGTRQALRVNVPESARVTAGELLGAREPRLAVQLGASTDAKTWGVERFAETLRALARIAPDLRVVLVGVASEEERAQKLEASCPETRFLNLVGRTRVDELAAVLEDIDVLLTGDTGTMHLAGAVGTTTCAVFVGLGTPYETAVYAEGHWALFSRIACAPCAHTVQCGNPVCHSDIPPEWLARLLERLVKDGNPAELPPLPRAELVRTCFDESGLLDLEPVHLRAATANDLMAAAYRALFLERLIGTPACPETLWTRSRRRFGIESGNWADALPTTLGAQLDALARLATRAERSTRSLGVIAGDAGALREAGKALHEINEAIYSTCRAEPLLAPLGLSHEADQEDLPDADLPILASMSTSHYRNLGRGVTLLRTLIRGPDASGPHVKED